MAAEDREGPVPPAELTVSALRPGDEVDGVLACTRKERLLTRAGQAYLALEFRDRTGRIPARAFRNADVLAGRFERGELVRVRGTVQRFRDQLVIECVQLERVRAQAGRAPQAAVAEFLPRAYRDLDELEGFLEHLAREVYDPGLRRLLDELLGDALLRAAWRRAPCTRGGHHSYLGGLLEHTVAVATLALETCQLHPRLNSDLLLTAAITHDIGLTRTFTLGTEIELSEEGRLLGHLAIGQRLVEERATHLDEPRRLALLHCLLSHHGAAGAPGGRFASPEAAALYRLNSLDATVKGVLEHGMSGETR
jgi:3'-5' exoribonuclease